MTAPTYTFGDFELNLRAEVLKKAGVRVHLASQPLKLLTLLVRRAGDLVTREEIQQELWTKGSVVDFDHVVNQYIRQLRSVLGDSREASRFIETAPRRGYRFIAAVGTAVSASAPTVEMPSSLRAEHQAPARAPARARGWPGKQTGLIASVVTLGAVCIVAVAFLRHYTRGTSPIGIVGGTLSPAVRDADSGAGRVAARDNTRTGGRRAAESPAQSPSSPLSPDSPDSPADLAHAAYVKGRYFFNQSTQAGFQKSCVYFKQAVAADPSYALAYKGMADCYMALSSAGLEPADQSMPKARAMARKAIELDASLPDGHAALGVILLNYDWNWPAAYAELDAAERLAPTNLDTHVSLAAYYRIVGRVDAAARELKRAEALDPVSAKSYMTLGWLYIFSGRHADAVGELQKSLELAPDSPYAHFGLFLAYDHTGRRTLAMSELQRYLALQKEAEIASSVARTYQSAGYSKARRRYFELMAAAFVKRHYLSYQIAGEYALLGDKDKALDYLELAYREHSNHMAHLKVDSYFDSLREEPRFQHLMQQMGLTDEQLASAATLAASNH